VAEEKQVGEPEARRIGTELRLRLGEAGELGVGRGQENNVARRLAEVDSLAAVGDRTGLGGEEMHRFSRRSPP
jgi:hypothetical protein